MWTSWPTIRSRPLKLEFEIPTNKTKEFWDWIDKGDIYTTRCKNCGELFWPPVADCPYCKSSDMDWVKLVGEGELMAFTHVIAKPASFQHKEPYTIAIGKLTDGVNVLAWLMDADITKVKIGMKIKLTVGTNQDGDSTYWFVPI